jgi:hypothetical protein
MQSVARLLVVVFAAFLGALPALRAGCDLDCGRHPLKPAGHCSNHSEPAGHAPTKDCGHDHASIGMPTHAVDASAKGILAIPASVPAVAIVLPVSQQVTLWTTTSVPGTSPGSSSSLPLRI